VTPSAASGFGGPGGAFGRGGFTGGLGGANRRGFAGGTGAAGGFPGGTPPTGALPGGGFPGGGASRRALGGGAGVGGPGGILGSSTPGAALTKLLTTDASRYTWVAATVNSNSAAGYQLASNDPVMAIGGFNGTDPAPTLAQFEKYVAQGKIHYFISGSGGGFSRGGSSGTSSQITSWVTSHFTATTVNGTTIYDLTAPSTST
jgi:hypothetical protein